MQSPPTTAHVRGMASSNPSDMSVCEADLALVRSAASASVDNAPTLPPLTAARIAAQLRAAPATVRDAS